MSTVSTHVLDTANGAPAVGMSVRFARWDVDRWVGLGEQTTDEDGRAAGFEASAGRHRLAFETGDHGNAFYPFVHVVFQVEEDRDHYHVPLLLSPFGYTTYRGS